MSLVEAGKRPGSRRRSRRDLPLIGSATRGIRWHRTGGVSLNLFGVRRTAVDDVNSQRTSRDCPGAQKMG